MINLIKIALRNRKARKESLKGVRRPAEITVNPKDYDFYEYIGMDSDNAGNLTLFLEDGRYIKVDIDNVCFYSNNGEVGVKIGTYSIK